MLPRILAWRKHHGKVGATVTMVWAAPRWRTALEAVPRRRMHMLPAPRWCSATELAPRQRTGATVLEESAGRNVGGGGTTGVARSTVFSVNTWPLLGCAGGQIVPQLPSWRFCH